MKQQEGKSGRWFVRLMTSLLQFLYNRIYITGIQTLRIFARIRNRLIRFLRPLGDLFRRLYARFLRRRVRFLHFSGVRILRNLRWESGKIKRTHQTHGLRKAIVHVTRSTSHRAVLSAAVQVVLPLAAVGFLVLTIQFWNNQNYALFLDYGGEESIVIEDEGVFEEATEMMNHRMVFDAATETELRVHGVYQLGIVSPGVCKSVDTVCDSLIQSSSDVISEAAGLYVNGELTGVVRSSTDLRYLLETMLSDEKAEQKADSAEYLESVELINGLFPTERIESADAVRKTMEDELHIMVSRKETYTESISYKTVTQKDSSQYTDYSKVTQQGEEGELFLGDIFISLDHAVVQAEEYGTYPGESAYLESVRRSKMKTALMLANIDRAMEELRVEYEGKEMRYKYDAFKMHYIDGISNEDIADCMNCGKNTPARWSKELIRKMSVKLFGVDGTERW